MVPHISVFLYMWFLRNVTDGGLKFNTKMRP